MEQVLILVMLAGASRAFLPAAETQCNATKNTSRCSATVGGSVYIQMVTNTSGLLLRCKKQLPGGYANVFTLKKQNVVFQEALTNRTEFFIKNGTFKITSAERNDSGRYVVEVFNLNGLHVGTLYVKLDVQENYLPTLILVSCVLAALLMLVGVSCVSRCIYRKVKGHRKSGKRCEPRHGPTELQTQLYV